MPISRNSARPGVEALENRFLLAANVTATLSQGVLKIEGTERNDFIVVRQVPTSTGSVIRVDGVTISGQGVVNRIEVNALGGNDIVRLDANNTAGQAVRIPTLVWGGNGNDFIVGGLANDELQGNADNDTIYGLDGNDTLFGHAGNDLLIAGAGNDALVGGSGHDELDGESGNDNLWGESGDDFMRGGSGDDYLDGGSGADYALGGSGQDRFRNLDGSLNDSCGCFSLVGFFSPIRRINYGDTGIQDFRASEGDRIV